MIETRLLYSSSNGDRWFLVRDIASETVLVKHEPNRSSGGRNSMIDVAEFLTQNHGPQHKSLLRMIGTLVEGGVTPEAKATTPDEPA